ncbi:phage holin family protein [Sporolactobacillus laevolacticus]|uniref:phage holin family protein n=1 Tax=Sporolactobacillus laevolacticus TaxID=33018 RepID=UPI0025B514C7|nr:phage holin family protein [Sporolactobacillus laevolacticus]MDN3953784.1 phage holin family protein [Sporolactobacillus laevolacticus]
MNKYEFVYRAAAPILGAVTGYLYGGWSPMFRILITFVIIDYVTGMLAASYTYTLSSNVGFRGIAKKVMLFFLY